MSPAARPARNFVPLGVIVSSAPRTALLAALRRLRPQLEIHLLEIAPLVGTDKTGYRVEVGLSGDAAEASSIDLWLQIKSALMAEFPAGRPDAVSAMDQ